MGMNKQQTLDIGWGGRDWLDHALCRSHPTPDIWISENQHERNIAARLCQDCPVIYECLAAVRTIPRGQRWYVWGGIKWSGPMTPRGVA